MDGGVEWLSWLVSQSVCRSVVEQEETKEKSKLNNDGGSGDRCCL